MGLLKTSSHKRLSQSDRTFLRFFYETRAEWLRAVKKMFPWLGCNIAPVLMHCVVCEWRMNCEWCHLKNSTQMSVMKGSSLCVWSFTTTQVLIALRAWNFHLPEVNSSRPNSPTNTKFAVSTRYRLHSKPSRYSFPPSKKKGKTRLIAKWTPLLCVALYAAPYGKRVEFRAWILASK